MACIPVQHHKEKGGVETDIEITDVREIPDGRLPPRIEQLRGDFVALAGPDEVERLFSRLADWVITFP